MGGLRGSRSLPPTPLAEHYTISNIATSKYISLFEVTMAVEYRSS